MIVGLGIVFLRQNLFDILQLKLDACPNYPILHKNHPICNLLWVWSRLWMKVAFIVRLPPFPRGWYLCQQRRGRCRPGGKIFALFSNIFHTFWNIFHWYINCQVFFGIEGQKFGNCAKIDGQTTRTPVSSKIFGLASILVRATTLIINANVVNNQFECDRCQISSKARRMCNHPVFCNKVGIRVGYLAVLDLESTDHQATWRQSTNSGHVLKLKQKMCKTRLFQ